MKEIHTHPTGAAQLQLSVFQNLPERKQQAMIFRTDSQHGFNKINALCGLHVFCLKPITGLRRNLDRIGQTQALLHVELNHYLCFQKWIIQKLVHLINYWQTCLTRAAFVSDPVSFATIYCTCKT